MPRPTIEEYRESLRGLTNRQLIDKAAGAILGAAVMAGMWHNDGWEDACADACYDEARRRGNVDLYQRAFNSAVRSQGHHQMARRVRTPIHVGDPTLASAPSRQQGGPLCRCLTT